MPAVDPGPLSNKLLAALPRNDFQLLLPHLTTAQIAQGEVLYEAGIEVDQVFCPLSGMVSLVAVMRDGRAIETATIGREGVVGAMSGLGVHITRVRAIVQLPIFVGQISATRLRTAVVKSKPIASLCVRYNEMLLVQARITAAYNAVHHVEARFCRWLLAARDCAENDIFNLTQEFIECSASDAPRSRKSPAKYRQAARSAIPEEP
jgi:CRP-like cAMP-binding protein